MMLADIWWEPHPADDRMVLLHVGPRCFKHKRDEAALNRLKASWGTGRVELICECETREVDCAVLNRERGSCPECAQDIEIRRPKDYVEPKPVEKKPEPVKRSKRKPRRKKADVAAGVK